jgi:phospholipid/cholesterol/gamma-HCH transport system substrate-binding protein
MNDRVMQFRVGVVVLATMIIGALLMTLNSPLPTGWLPWGAGTYEVAIELQEAPGIGPNTPVRKNGLLIGRVGSVEDLNDRVVVRADIDDDRQLYPQYTPVVRTSVLGDATIDFVTRPIPPETPPLEDGAVIKGEVEPNPFEALAEFTELKGDLQDTIESLGRAGDGVANLAERVDRAFGEETDRGRVDRLLDTTERAMSELGNAAAAFNEILGTPATAETPAAPPASGGGATRGFPVAYAQVVTEEPEVRIEIEDGAASRVLGRSTADRLKQGLNEFPDLVRDARVTLKEFREMTELAEQNFRNLQGFTEPLGQRGDQIAQSIIDSAEGLDRLIEEFTVLSQAVNNPAGTLGQLIHNRQLSDNLNRLIGNANCVILRADEIAKRVQVVVEDARVFMDKVAREPGRIIGGAVNPSLVK